MIFNPSTYLLSIPEKNHFEQPVGIVCPISAVDSALDF